MLTPLNIRVTFDKGPMSSKWMYKCDCGVEVAVLAMHVKSGNTSRCRRCGAIQQGATRTKKVEGIRSIEHPLYGTWKAIHYRCYNSNAPKYRLYGGRGIKVYPTWHTFENFVRDMGPKPTLKHTVERKDNDGDYEPSNCKWATMKEQRANQRRNPTFSTLSHSVTNSAS